MTEKEPKHHSEQEGFFTEMKSSLQIMRQEAETLAQSLGLPMEAKYDILAALYDQTQFFQAEIVSDCLIGREKEPTEKIFSRSNAKEAGSETDKNNPYEKIYAQNCSEDSTTKARNSQLYPYQQRVYEAITNGRNVILHAPTGAGKTRAALLPFLANLVRGGKALPLACRYIVPQDVLANQLYCEHQFLTEKSEQFIKGDTQKSHQQIGNATIAVQTSEQPEDPQMEAALNFCTIDQLLASFLNISYERDFEETNPTIAGVLSSYLVLDEFHLYSLHNSNDAFNERIAALQMLRLFKRTTPFILLTATSSSALLQRLHTLLDAEIISVKNMENSPTSPFFPLYHSPVRSFLVEFSCHRYPQHLFFLSAMSKGPSFRH